MINYHDFNTGNNWLDEALENYLMYGLEPGGFLTSVLANDLRLAVNRADHWNKPNIDIIVREVFFKVPDVAAHSYQAVRDWCADKDGRRSHYVYHKEKEYTFKVLKGEVREKSIQEPPF